MYETVEPMYFVQARNSIVILMYLILYVQHPSKCSRKFSMGVTITLSTTCLSYKL